MPDLNTPESLTMCPFGEERKTKWWPVSRAAYGTVLQPTGEFHEVGVLLRNWGLGARDEVHQPFILPAMNPANGSFDNEMHVRLLLHLSSKDLCF